jgi:VWFA-related protein
MVIVKFKLLVKKSAVIIYAVLLAVIPAGQLFSVEDKAARFERAKEDFTKGHIYFNSMNYLAAAEFFRKALSAYPDYFTAREYLARSYRLAGYMDEARTEWELLYKDSSSPAVKSKIDLINARQAHVGSRIVNEFFSSKRIDSNDMGRYRFDAPTDIAVDTNGNSYIVSFTLGKLIKLSPDGKALDEKSFDIGSKLYGIDCMNNLLVVSDFGKDKVTILSADSLAIKISIGKRGEGEGSFHGPEGVCFDAKGYFYVADAGNNRIQKFSPDGTFILAFGKPGRYEGELSNPTDMTVTDGKVFVSDSGNARIAVFDESGNFLNNISIDGLKIPRGITSRENTLVIADEKAGICFYDFANKESLFFHDWDDGKGSFSRVSSALFDRDGFLYAADYSRQSAFIFSPLAARYTNLDVEIQSVDIKKYPMVAYYVAVRDRSGKPVYGLTTEDFEVVEDGARIRNPYITYLRDSEPSITAAIAVDRSVQSKPYAAQVGWAAEFVLKKLHKNDAVTVIQFNKDYWTGNNFDWSRRRALKALSENAYAEGKAFGRTIYNAVGELAPRINRRACIVITDGSIDNDSFRQYSEQRVIDYASEHFVPVYFVVFKQADPSLERIARSTGGAVIRASQLDTLDSLYERIKRAEEYRYAIVYRSFKGDDFADWWSDISIKVNLKGVSGVEWFGYFVPRLKGGIPRSAGKMPTTNGAAPAGSSGGSAQPAAQGGGEAPKPAAH